MTILPPLFLLDTDDVSVFSSVDELISYVEPSDISDPQVSAFDSEGRRIKLQAESAPQRAWRSVRSRTVVEPQDPPAYEPDALLAALRDFVTASGHERFGLTEGSLEEVPLPEMVQRVSAVLRPNSPGRRR